MADALGYAHNMRAGGLRQAYIKSESCYRTRLLLTHRRSLKAKFLDLEKCRPPFAEVVCHPPAQVGRGAFEQAVREAVACDPLSSELMDAMLSVREALWKQYCRRHDLVVKMVARSEPCRRFMAIPGVGPVTALSFIAAIDDPARFRAPAISRPIWS